MDCHKCPECEYGRAVTGYGILDAKVCILGCNPSFTDSRARRPFAGTSRRKLLEGLAAAKILTLQCWLANVVKCPTPPGILPAKQTYEVCVETWLWKELGALKKLQAILCLGRQALFCFEKGKKIEDIHGKFFESSVCNPGESVIIFSTFHPSQAQRNKEIDRFFLQDMEAFGNLFRTL